MLVDVSGDEFESFMEILNKMQHLSTSEGSQQVIDIISEQAELEEEFQVYTGLLQRPLFLQCVYF